jgi:hypothetical protein
VRWTAVAGSPFPTHETVVTEADFERGVASLAEHRAYIAALSDQDPESYARDFLRQTMTPPEGGRLRVSFQLYPR